MRRVLVFAALVACSDAIASPFLLDLGTLGGSDAFATAVTPDGAVVVGMATTPSEDGRAFRWSEFGGLEDLGVLAPGNPPASIAYAVSADGNVVVGVSHRFGRPTAFRWDANAGLTSLGTLGGLYSQSLAVNADGSIIVGTSYTSTQQQHAFRWIQGLGMTSLSPTGYGASAATAIDRCSGVVFGFAQPPEGGGSVAGRWDVNGVWQTLVAVPNGSASAVAASCGGEVVLGAIQMPGVSGQRAFLQATAGEVRHVLLPQSTQIEPRAISGDGHVAGGGMYVLGDPKARAWVWTEPRGGMDLKTALEVSGIDLTGWMIESIAGISADGTVLVGSGYKDGRRRAIRVSDFVALADRCPSDLNRDLLVDDADFVLFADAYNELLAASGDFNLDGQTDDADFVLFADAYDGLLCP